jgi:hypothetical protein
MGVLKETMININKTVKKIGLTKQIYIYIYIYLLR